MCHGYLFYSEQSLSAWEKWMIDKARREKEHRKTKITERVSRT